VNHLENINLYIRAKHAYFNTEEPIMSDAQFDLLESEIRAAYPGEPELGRVGHVIPTTTNKAKHRIHMGSQEKVYSFEELTRWEKLRANNGEALFHASLKADGGSLALYYENGRLVQAVTRGDGDIGQDVTAQARLFKGVPSVLPVPLDIGVRCESVLTMNDWAIVDPKKESNPRNLVNGILGRLDCHKAKYVSCRAFDWDLLGPTHIESAPTELAKFRRLELLGMVPVTHINNATLEEVGEWYQSLLTRREYFEYWADGLVIRYEDIDLQQRLGSADNRPKGQVAWKFPAEGATTKIRDVQWQVGHTGAITPVAIVDPVRIGGTTVSKASLANPDNIATLGAFLGAEVEVVKSGDIIPQITKVNSEYAQDKGCAPIVVPTFCPVCNGPVGKRQNSDGSETVLIYCEGDDCDAQAVGRLLRFARSRDILGLGKALATALIEDGCVEDVGDLYKLKDFSFGHIVLNPEKGSKLGNTKAESLVAEIRAKAMRMSVPEFIGAFGTRSLGVRRATLMAEANPDLQHISAWLDGSLNDPDFAARSGVPSAGSQIAEGIAERLLVINKCLKHVALIDPEPKAVVTGKTICITGVLPSGKKKKEYAEPLAAAGHLLVDDLTKDTNILVMADPTGPESAKTKKAKKLGVELWSESQLQALINPLQQ